MAEFDQRTLGAGPDGWWCGCGCPKEPGELFQTSCWFPCSGQLPLPENPNPLSLRSKVCPLMAVDPTFWRCLPSIPSPARVFMLMPMADIELMLYGNPLAATPLLWGYSGKECGWNPAGTGTAPWNPKFIWPIEWLTSDWLPVPLEAFIATLCGPTDEIPMGEDSV